MLPLIAIPVIHSSGAWIASTAAGGYLASTLSASWAGAFIAGNAGLLSGLAAASVAGVGGFFAGAGSAVSGAASSAGVALGVISAPVWPWVAAGVGAVAAVAGGVGYYKRREILKAIEGQLEEINAERIKGGLKPFESASDALADVISFWKEEEKAESFPYRDKLLGK